MYKNWLEIERGYGTTYLEGTKNEIEKKQIKLVTFKYLEFCQGKNGIEQQGENERETPLILFK